MLCSKKILIKYGNMVLIGILFFNLGCFITLNFLHINCVDATVSLSHEQRIPTDYVVLILTSPTNTNNRDSIRATWMNLGRNIIEENGVRVFRWNSTWIGEYSNPHFIKYYFAIGTHELHPTIMNHLEEENARNKDLLLLKTFKDSYENLSVKVLHTMQWIHENLKDVKYVVKCDDDSFVRIDLIVQNLENFGPAMNAPDIQEFVSFKKTLPAYKGLYWGYFNGKARVMQKGKWQEKDWFLCDHYLPYAQGGAYVISGSIMSYIGRNHDLFSTYKAEDVSMGVWTSALDGINRVHDTRFDTEWKSRGCTNTMLVLHKRTPSDMFDVYTALVYTKGQKLCKTESHVRNSYKYNWEGLPSKCCEP